MGTRGPTNPGEVVEDGANGTNSVAESSTFVMSESSEGFVNSMVPVDLGETAFVSWRPFIPAIDHPRIFEHSPQRVEMGQTEQ